MRMCSCSRRSFWSILIGLYTGLRLGEISMLIPRDFRVEDGVHIIDLVSDATRQFKSEAGDRKIPLHPHLIALKLPFFVEEAKRVNAKMRIPTQTSRRFRCIPAGDSDGSQPVIPTHSSHP